MLTITGKAWRDTPVAKARSDTAFAVVNRWLMDRTLPFWAERGVDRVCGGYVEQMSFGGTARPVDFKRTRVIGRQIYVFSHSAILGRKEDLAIARHGYDFLTANAWLGPNRGWARQLSPSGEIKDATPDLYDLAFVLFALGWFFRASGDPAAYEWAIRTLDFVDTHMRHPGNEGFLTEKPSSGARLQNPHMHLLEAALVNLEATGDPCFRRIADEIVDLFERRFFDPVASTLREYYDEIWSPISGPRGQIVEPGHHFEWAWILANYQRLTKTDVRHFAGKLTWFAETHGVARGKRLALNEVSTDGTVLDAGSRVWPNTERIQAAVAMFELFGTDPRPVIESSTRVLFDHFLDRGLIGGWVDRVDADGRPGSDHVPASTLYHLMVAFTEMLRIEPDVEAAFGRRAVVPARSSSVAGTKAEGE